MNATFSLTLGILMMVVSVGIGCRPPEHYRLVWSEEFKGEVLHSDRWNIETGGDGWGNRELQFYTENGNLSLENDCLVITAKKNKSGPHRYTSARINTRNKFAVQYGKIEARIKLPYGKGLWPAFWMLGSSFQQVGHPLCGEIDILEMIGGEDASKGFSDSVIWGSLHWVDRRRNQKSLTAKHAISRKYAQDFHVFGITWDSQSIRFSVDHHVYQTVSLKKGRDGLDVFHRPFFIILNLAVGGNWPGPPDETTQWPQKMMVDWVRVYQKLDP